MGSRRPQSWLCARANSLGARRTTRKNKPGFPLCAASNPSQFNESAQSNQQDLIGKMEPNRQQKPAGVQSVLLGENTQQHRIFVEYRRDMYQARLEQYLGDRVVRGANIRTLYTLTLVRPVMMVGGLTLLAMRVPVTRRTLIPHSLGMSGIASLRAIVCMVHAAAHHEVDHQDRRTQIVQ